MENVHFIGRWKCVFKPKKTTLDGFIKKYTVVQFSGTKRFLKVGVINAQGPPVPIPNTEVKLCSAENTLLEAARENRSTPTSPESISQGTHYGGVAQLGEHLPCKQGVMGSNPIISTTRGDEIHRDQRHGLIAQKVRARA